MPIGIVLLVLFVAIPLIELYVLIEVGAEIGAISTIALTVFTAVLGGLLVRLQGLSVLFRVREVTEQGGIPAVEMVEGAVLLLAGLTLLLPGLITDALGFILLVTPIRRALILALLRRYAGLHPGAVPPRDEPPPGQRTIEGEWRREDDRD